ncbi:LysR family transcriptional regulator [Pseudomonas oryzihabitans]|uniref:LysR family transcriptional regulator n=1 Tax=Pseudomonas oryzihabitans TaxID=47885 RepID=UPI00214F1D28|nr:LysR family transcriptional regulator [Pseudomonas psychrotolerans]UUW69822.1 LysR family transcriptional regulator [Pseudomonas psychrotolerans]
MDLFAAMQTFVRVVEAGSFTRAAETLGSSRTRVTQQVRLLNRTTRQVQVTADGAAYYDRCLGVLAAVDDAETGLSVATRTPRGRLRVDVPSPLARLILIPALPDFFERYPDIQLELGVSDRQVDLIGDNVDCVIRGGRIREQYLVARPLGALQLGCYAAPAYLAAQGVPVHPAELAETPHRVVRFLWGRGKGFPYALQRGAERLELQGRHSLEVDDGNACLAAGQAGLGVVCLPHYLAAEAVDRGELVRLFADWQVAPLPLYLAFAPNRHVSAKLRVFIDWVTAVVAERAWLETPGER